MADVPKIPAVSTVGGISGRRRGMIGVSVACTLAAMGGLALAALSPSVSAALIAGIVVAISVPLAVRALNSELDAFEPIVVFAIIWSIMFVIRPIAMLVENDFTYVYAPTIDLRHTFNGMLVLALIGTVSFAVGYGSAVGRALAARLPRPVEHFQASRVALVCMVIGAVALVLYAGYVVQVGGLSAALSRSGSVNELRQGSSAYFYMAPLMLIGPVLTIFALRSRLNVVNSFFIGGGLFAAALIIFISYGARSSLLFLGGGGVVYWYLAREVRPRAITFVLGLAVVLLVSAIIGATRDVESRGSTGALPIAKGIVQHPTTVFRPLTSEADAAEAPGLAAAMSVIPKQLQHTYGAGFLIDLLGRPIPRQLWPGKPLSPVDKTTATLSPTGYRTAQANPEYSCLLVPFIDFGYFGGLVLVLYGIAARALFEWFRRYRTAPMAQIIFSLTLPLMVFVLRDNAVNVIYRGLPLLAPVCLAFVIGRVRE